MYMNMSVSNDRAHSQPFKRKLLLFFLFLGNSPIKSEMKTTNATTTPTTTDVHIHLTLNGRHESANEWMIMEKKKKHTNNTQT